MKRYSGAMVLIGLLLAPMLVLAVGFYGSLAYNHQTGAAGIGRDRQTQSDADFRATLECGDDCRVVVRFRNSCAAYAVGDKGNGWGIGPSLPKAKSEALKQCQDKTENCSIRVSGCA